MNTIGNHYLHVPVAVSIIVVPTILYFLESKPKYENLGITNSSFANTTDTC